MTYLTKLKAQLRQFAEDTRGTLAVESVIVLPVLFWALLGGYVFFDAYRQISVNTKANYTIGDLVSRETEAINDEYIDSMQALFAMIAKADSDARLRITVAMWDEEDNAYKLDWTESRANAPSISQAELNAMKDELPELVDNERMILVETWTDYEPLFKVGMAASEFYNLSVTSPRFAPLVAWRD